MDKLTVKRIDYTNLLVDCSPSVAAELNDVFSFYVPNHKWIPSVRNKVWDGKIRIFNYKTHHFPAGLYDHLEDFCNKRDYQIQLIESDYGLANVKSEIDPREIMNFIDGLNLHSRGNKISIRDYQFNGVCKALESRRQLLLSPTGSGKSLIIYTLIRYLLRQLDDKILIVVPTTSLVEQMYSDFADYSEFDDSFNVQHVCHKIYSGKEKTNVHERVFISTWQSIFRLGPKWFQQFGAVFGDEAHGFQAKSMSSIMNKAKNAEYRIGTTGTLNDAKTHELVLQGLFGPIHRVTTTKKLQDEDTLAQLKINMIELTYPDQIRKTFGKQTYQSEIDWIVQNQERNEFITKLACSLEGNTLLLFQFVDKHGKVLHQMIKDTSPNFKVFYVSGETDKSDREAIRSIVEQQHKSITVASSGVFSTGVNIKNIHNIIFSSPSKSQIRVLQSIGRGLRKSDNGKPTKLYDIVDNLCYGRRKNYAVRHAEERHSIYNKEQFDVKVHKVQL